jgi:hypothetical protein
MTYLADVYNDVVAKVRHLQNTMVVRGPTDLRMVVHPNDWHRLQAEIYTYKGLPVPTWLPPQICGVPIDFDTSMTEGQHRLVRWWGRDLRWADPEIDITDEDFSSACDAWCCSAGATL